MTLILCLDDALGMAFNRRRQSSDSAVCRDIARLADGEAICMDERSVPLFERLDVSITSGDAPFRFVEFAPPGPLAEKAERLVIYRWNRRYPADLKSDISFDSWLLTEATEFPGTSHEKISREVYIRENE